MKKFLLIAVAFTFALQSYGRHLNAYFSYCTFNQPGGTPYIETYLNVAGTSVMPALNSENQLQGKIEVQWVYKQDDKIISFDKYNLLSPSTPDTMHPIADFIDLQRVSLPNGKYILELKITDKNSSEQSFTTTQQIFIDYPEEKVTISDIEFLESYTPTSEKGIFSKSGYDMVPLVYNFFPASVNTLKFYAEIYNTKKITGDGDFLVRYSISGHQNKSIINNLVSFKKQKSADVNIVMSELPIADISSGNYTLHIEVRDKSNQLRASKEMFFQRSNPVQVAQNPDDLSSMKIENTFVSYMTNNDTLKDYISSLYPISSRFESDFEENQINGNNLESMQKFFYYFWSKRNPSDPETEWLRYKANVNSVNAEFSCPGRRGYESDRGRVYLQYGSPTSIDKTYFEGAVYPYEIWQYNTTGEQSNVKFVFLSRNLSANCFELIHSTAKGEFYDSNWQTRLISESKSNSMFGDVDRGDNSSKVGTRARDDFDHPK